MKPTIVVGAGISGLSAAYYLAKSGRPSVILEPRPRAGGVIQTEHLEGCVIEGGPDSFLAAKPEALAMIRELGLESEIISSNDHQRKTFIRKRGRMIPMPDGLMMVVPTKIIPMAASGLLSWATKIRMGLEFFRKPAATPPPDRSIADFIKDHYGQETVDYLAEPLLAGVYGGNPSNLSINSVLPRFADLEKKYGSLTRGVLANRPKGGGGPLFRSLKGGLGQWVDAILEAIAGKCEIRQMAAEAVEQTAGGFRVKAGGDWLEAENLVLACEAYNSAKLLGGRLAQLLNGIEYTSSITVCIIYDGPQPMPGFGFLIPAKERRQILAATWVGTKFPHRAPEGKNLVRCFLTGEKEPDIAEIHRELKDISGIQGEPRLTRVFRWPRSMAQYGVGHAPRIAEVQSLVAATPGLHLAGNAYGGIGLPDCVRSGKQAAQKILES